ncbi:lipocalin-like domain-containing protein [Thalassobaculum sp.]|uniref:lipocalin-like domain-containing protein n=1 Tax=Thalassobaculum sp. TaxID=2022740 RepID=UPI0032EDD6A8
MPDIVGTWRLVETTAHDPDGNAMPQPYGPSPMGVVTFNAEGRMMAVLCDGRTAMPDEQSAREYASYCGNYTFDGTRLITKADAASHPSRMAIDQVRQVSFEGERMVLRPPIDQVGGVARQRVLTWEKISPK